MVNRASVLTIWAAVVAEVQGFEHDEALTQGRAGGRAERLLQGGFPGALPAASQGGQRTAAEDAQRRLRDRRPVTPYHAGKTYRNFPGLLASAARTYICTFD
jgi:hypothetical protein